MLEKAYEEHGDPERARAMSAYMRNLFTFLGLPTPLRRSLGKPFLQALPPGELEAEVCRLWSLAPREYQYHAVELAARSRKLWEPSTLELFRFMIETRSWWDTVDAVAGLAVGCCRNSRPWSGRWTAGSTRRTSGWPG